ncbi:MAG: glycoside hydrolase family 172 protein [Planctomycetota bacterium]
MRRTLRVGLCGIWVAGVLSAQVDAPRPAVAERAAPRWDLEHMFWRLFTLHWIWQPPVEGERCVQFSSYDRRSDRGAAAGASWYANQDRGHYLRVVDGANGKEHVMVDVEGPGCLARLWSANPEGTLHFDIDGERVWSVDFAALCTGRAGVPEPLAAMRSRGGNVYLPVLFGERLVVSATAADLYYLADVALAPPGTEVEPFRPEQLEGKRSRMARVLSEAAFCGGWVREVPETIPAGHLVDELYLRVERDEGVEVAEVLRRTRLQVTCGDERLVDVPVTAFFGGGPDWKPWAGRWLGVTDDGDAYCKLPMPFPRDGSIRLHTEGAREGVRLSLGCQLPRSQMPEQPLLFRAGYHVVKAQPTRPFSDHVVLDATGKGRFVGCSLLVRNPSRIWWGEGDEKFLVDGEAFPSWFGTGTEDYFGYAWCDPTPFVAPLHAQVQCEGPNNYGFTQLHRTHVLDSVPFQRSFRFDLERWHWVEDLEVDYETVAYWYGAAGAGSGLPAVPPFPERRLERLPPPKMLVVDGALEGEGLRVISCSGGTHEVQNLAFFEGRFSRDAHRWWRDGKVGDALVLGVPVPASGRYRITVGMTRADDFARVQLSIGDTLLGEPFDGYAAQVEPSGRLVAGVVDLEAGEQPLRLRLVGKNPKAKDRMMVGLDYLLLEKVR